MRFQILRSAPNSFWWRMVAANGEVLAHSEQYASKASCLHAIEVVRREAAGAQVIDRT